MHPDPRWNRVSQEQTQPPQALQEQAQQALESGNGFDPSNPETFELIIDDMIEYFEETEEYEKCQTLVKLKNSKTLIRDLNKRLKTSEDDT